MIPRLGKVVQIAIVRSWSEAPGVRRLGILCRVAEVEMRSERRTDAMRTGLEEGGEAANRGKEKSGFESRNRMAKDVVGTVN